jgi:hypothetical protein
VKEKAMPKMSLTRALGFSLLTAGLAAAGGCGGGDDDKNVAVMKFCNPLSLQNNQPLDLTLEVGSDKPVIITAGSGTCVPKVKDACLKIPVGKNVPVVLKMGTDKLAQAIVDDIVAGEEWLILADLDDMTMAPTVSGGKIPAAAGKCADLAFTDIFDTTGGTQPQPMPSPTPRI